MSSDEQPAGEPERRAATDPLRVDWVDLKQVPGTSGLPGRLGMTFIPGKVDPAGGHDRDLDLDVAELRRTGVDELFLLVEDQEQFVRDWS